MRVIAPAFLVPAAVLLAGCGEDSGTPPTEPVLRVVRMTPAARSVSASPGPITLFFDRPLRRESVVPGRSLHVFARADGTVRGSVGFAEEDRALVFTPARPLAAGQTVTVLVSREVQGADGLSLGPGGYSAQFWTRAAPAPASFTEIERHSTRPTPFSPSRAYGGQATDLDGDRDADLAIVNEETADLVVFRNSGAGSFVPTGERFAAGERASPSEAGDFDRDGTTDLAVVNIAAGTVTILLGRGDGGFRPPQVLVVGETPRGIAGLDVDGDADLDLAVATFDTDDVAILLDEGGTFRVASRVDSGLRGEWAIAAADMDEDGLLDLVVGAQGSEAVGILRNLGTGSFSVLGRQDAGGRPWMLVTGDIDRDSHDDVAVVNGLSDTAAVLRGDGRGGLLAPAVQAVDPFALASDLGDLDGDGDLDWMTSSYTGDWRLFENRSGVLFVARELAPREAASCALLFDADGDGDLDLALIDEEADEVILMRNGG
jgi:VCBS repeat protein/Big-like domain-containing protein